MCPKMKWLRPRLFLSDILEAKEKGNNFWWRWLDRFGSYCDEKFGAEWRNKDKEFWKKLKYSDCL
jgi:hypothetical protein